MLKQIQKTYIKNVIKKPDSLTSLYNQIDILYNQLKENLESLLTTNKGLGLNQKKDLIVGYGEKISALVYRQFFTDNQLNAVYHTAEDLIKTNSYFQNAFPDMVETNNLIQKT